MKYNIFRHENDKEGIYFKVQRMDGTYTKENLTLKDIKNMSRDNEFVIGMNDCRFLESYTDQEVIDIIDTSKGIIKSNKSPNWFKRIFTKS